MDIKTLKFADVVNILFILFMIWNVGRAYHFIP
jgi:hypothetical protein